MPPKMEVKGTKPVVLGEVLACKEGKHNDKIVIE